MSNSDDAKITKDGLIAAAKAGWDACRKSIYAVCEDVQEEADQPITTDVAEHRIHAQGYQRGQTYAAKSIARGFNSMEAEDDDNFIAAVNALASEDYEEAEPYEVLGVTHDGVKILAPKTVSKNFTREQVRETIIKAFSDDAELKAE